MYRPQQLFDSLGANVMPMVAPIAWRTTASSEATVTDLQVDRVTGQCGLSWTHFSLAFKSLNTHDSRTLGAATQD